MSQPVLRNEAIFIPAPGDAPLCKDQAHDTFMSCLTLEINCNWTSLLHDSAPTRVYKCLFWDLIKPDVCRQSFHPCHVCDLASNGSPSVVRPSSAPTTEQQPLCLSKLLPVAAELMLGNTETLPPPLTKQSICLFSLPLTPHENFIRAQP